MSDCVRFELTIKDGTFTVKNVGGTHKNNQFHVGGADCVCFRANEDCIVHFDDPDFFDPPESKIELEAKQVSDCLTILDGGLTEWHVTQTIATNRKYKTTKRGGRMTTTIMAADSSVAVMVEGSAEVELEGNPDPIIKP